MGREMSFQKSKNFCIHKCEKVTVDYWAHDLFNELELEKLFHKIVPGRWASEDLGRATNFYFENKEDAFQFKIMFSTLPDNK